MGFRGAVRSFQRVSGVFNMPFLTSVCMPFNGVSWYFRDIEVVSVRFENLSGFPVVFGRYQGSLR